MIDTITNLLDVQGMFLILAALLFARALTRILSSDNPVEAWHFIASRGPVTQENPTGQYGDPKKLAVIVFIFASTLFVGYMLWAHPVDNFWIVCMFFGWSTAMLGIDVFPAWARSFADRRFAQSGQQGPGAPPSPDPNGKTATP